MNSFIVKILNKIDYLIGAILGKYLRRFIQNLSHKFNLLLIFYTLFLSWEYVLSINSHKLMSSSKKAVILNRGWLKFDEDNIFELVIDIYVISNHLDIFPCRVVFSLQTKHNELGLGYELLWTVCWPYNNRILFIQIYLFIFRGFLFSHQRKAFALSRVNIKPGLYIFPILSPPLAEYFLN